MVPQIPSTMKKDTASVKKDAKRRTPTGPTGPTGPGGTSQWELDQFHLEFGLEMDSIYESSETSTMLSCEEDEEEGSSPSAPEREEMSEPPSPTGHPRTTRGLSQSMGASLRGRRVSRKKSHDPHSGHEIPVETETDPSIQKPRGPFIGCFSSLMHLLGRREIEPYEYSWFETQMVNLRNIPLVQRCAKHREDEVSLTYRFIDNIRALESTGDGPYTMAASKPHEMDGRGGEYPLLSDTVDAYQWLTWRWLSKRAEIEDTSVASSEENGFYTNVVQTVLSVAICIYAFSQEEATLGLLFFVTAGMIGVIGVVSATYGFVGCMSQSQSALRRFFACQCVLMKVVGAHLLVLATEISEQDRQCTPTLGSYAENEPSCTPSLASLGIATGLAIISLCTCFFSMYHTMTLIDGLSDREAVIQEVRMFRYFQRRIDEMELQMESLDTFELPRRVIGNDGDVDYLAVDADDEGM